MHRLAEKAGSGPFHYRLFGLRVESEMELPELRPVEPSPEPDVRIGWVAAGQQPGLLVDIDDIARFYVDGGDRIRVLPSSGAPARNIRLFLLGSAMGMLLHQRGLLPLHANAIEIDGKAVAFMGPSGSGKSTLAAWFHDRDYSVIADDVCVVRFDEAGTPWAEPGLPRLRLWLDAVEASGRRAADFERSYVDDATYEKYDVPIETAAKGGRELAAIYVLSPGEDIRIERCEGVRCAEALFANTYRGAFVGEAGGATAHWQACMRVASQVPLFELSRRIAIDAMEASISRVLAHFRATVSSCKPGHEAETRSHRSASTMNKPVAMAAGKSPASR